MATDREIRLKGFKALSNALGPVHAERFIALILKEPFDYTEWQKDLFEGKSIEELSAAATAARQRNGTEEPNTKGD
jgi:hypothetical protein